MLVRDIFDAKERQDALQFGHCAGAQIFVAHNAERSSTLALFVKESHELQNCFKAAERLAFGK